MAKKQIDFCDPSKLSILIPYKDFENLVQIASKYDDILKIVKHQEEQITAIRGMFSEALEKIAEIDRYL